MKLTNIKNIRDKMMTCKFETEQELSEEEHEFITGTIDFMMQELRGVGTSETIKVNDLNQIMDTMKFSLGDKLTEEVMDMNTKDWKEQIQTKTNEYKLRESKKDTSSGEVSSGGEE